jgi:hypothetical protein
MQDDVCDRIRLSGMLAALAGFAEPPDDAPHERWLPAWLTRRIMRLAAFPRTPGGAIAHLSAHSGRSRETIKVLINNARHGRIPSYWTS